MSDVLYRTDLPHFLCSTEAQPCTRQISHTTYQQRFVTASPPTRTRLTFDAAELQFDETPHRDESEELRRRQREGSRDNGAYEESSTCTRAARGTSPPDDARRKRVGSVGAESERKRRCPAKRIYTPTSERRKRTPQLTRSVQRRRDHQTPEKPRRGSSCGYEGNSVSLLDTLSPTKAADLQKVLFPMFKQRKPAHWMFIYLMCKAKYLHIDKRDRQSQHARCAYCVKCDIEITFKQSVTAHVTRHMKRCHSKELKQAEREIRSKKTVQPLVHREVEPASSNATEDCTEEEQKRADDLASIWVCKSSRPFTAVEDKFFRKYSRHLNSVQGHVRIPKAWRVRDRVGTISVDLRAVLKDEIEVECDFYSASSDIWTARNKLAFISFTIHYVDRQFNMRNWVLEESNCLENMMLTQLQKSCRN